MEYGEKTNRGIKINKITYFKKDQRPKHKAKHCKIIRGKPRKDILGHKSQQYIFGLVS